MAKRKRHRSINAKLKRASVKLKLRAIYELGKLSQNASRMRYLKIKSMLSLSEQLLRSAGIKMATTVQKRVNRRAEKKHEVEEEYVPSALEREQDAEIMKNYLARQAAQEEMNREYFRIFGKNLEDHVGVTVVTESQLQKMREDEIKRKEYEARGEVYDPEKEEREERERGYRAHEEMCMAAIAEMKKREAEAKKSFPFRIHQL